MTAAGGSKPETWTFIKEAGLVVAAALSPQKHTPTHLPSSPHRSTHKGPLSSPSPISVPSPLGSPASNTLPPSGWYLWLVQVPPSLVRRLVPERHVTRMTRGETGGQDERDTRHRRTGMTWACLCNVPYAIFHPHGNIFLEVIGAHSAVANQTPNVSLVLPPAPSRRRAGGRAAERCRYP